MEGQQNFEGTVAEYVPDLVKGVNLQAQGPAHIDGRDKLETQ